MSQSVKGLCLWEKKKAFHLRSTSIVDLALWLASCSHNFDLQIERAAEFNCLSFYHEAPVGILAKLICTSKFLVAGWVQCSLDFNDPMPHGALECAHAIHTSKATKAMLLCISMHDSRAHAALDHQTVYWALNPILFQRYWHRDLELLFCTPKCCLTTLQCSWSSKLICASF